MANGDIEATSTAKSSTSVATSVVNTASSAVGAVGMLSSVSGLTFGVSGLKLPLANPLHKYASMTQVFTLAALSPADLADPEQTYMKGGKLAIVIKTAGGSPNNRVKTKYGRFDFYIDDVTIKSNYGFEQGTGNTNATNISMTISEPYSMGMLPITLNQAAFMAGYKPGFRGAAFLLKIEFKGEDQNGNMVKIPNTTKYIPIQFRNLSMSVTEQGSVYQCDCIPVADTAFLSSNCTITTDMTITGSSVQEILQTGPKSLQAVLNNRLAEIAQKSKVPVPDQVVILFPADSAEKLTASKPGEDEKENAKSAVAPVIKPTDQADILKKLNVKRSDINKTLIQSSVNEIGASDLGYSDARQAKTPGVDVGKVYNEAGYLQHKFINGNPKICDYVFSQNSTIQNAINQVILTSDYAKNALKKDPDKLGMRTWWRIEGGLYHVDTDANDKVTGRKPYILVYKVVPYKVHSTTLPVPGTKTSKFKQLLDQCVKVYNYMYTGKNTDILTFKLDFDNRFVSALVPDAFQSNASTEAGKNDGTVKETQTAPVQEGGAPKNQQEAHGVIVNHKNLKPDTAQKGGGGEEEAVHAAARIFHDAIIFGQDLQQIELEIVGDPYWLTGNGSGNYTSPNIPEFMNISKDGSVNFQNGEVDMAINFRTPIDINSVTGLYDMAGKRSSQFSGIYKVQKVVHNFKNGQFTQVISAKRRNINPSDKEDIVFSTKKTETVPNQPVPGRPRGGA